MELLEKLIAKLRTPSSNKVGVYVSSDSKMEMVLYNIEMGEVKKYEKIDVKYNQVRREIDLEKFETAFMYLINKLEIPSNCPICVSLPNILTSINSFPSNLEDIELEVALSSEAEKSYIFKKTEPKVSWHSIYSNSENLTETYLYSVLQKTQVDEITRICQSNNLNLVSVDVAFTSLLRGLAASHIIDENIENHLKWCIIIISANNYIIAKFEGENLVNIIENPLALRSIEPEALYTTLNSTIFEKLHHEKLNNLYIVSQTQDFIAQKLADHMKIMCNIHTIDNNKFNGNPLFMKTMPSIDMDTVSPESIGAACWKHSKIGINFNFSDAEEQSELQGVFGQIGIKKSIHLYLLGGIILIGLLSLVFSLLLLGINTFLGSQISKHSSKITKLKTFNVSSSKEFNLNGVMNVTYNKNLEFLTSYDAIGAVIPEKLWIDSFFINNDLRIKLKGKSYTVDDIKTYFENLQKMAKFKNLKIKNIEIISTETNTSTENNFNDSRGNDQEILNLPPPPVPNSSSASNKNYYEFVFDNYNENDTKESFIDNLPDFSKNIFRK